MMPICIRQYIGIHAKNLFANLWRLFIDADRQDQLGPMGFDTTEPGYLRSLMDTFNFTLETLHQPLSVNFLIELNRRSVQKTTYLHQMKDENERTVFIPEAFSTGFRRTSAGEFGLNNNYTLSGVCEIYQLITSGILADVYFEVSTDSDIYKLDIDSKHIERAWEELLVNLKNKKLNLSLVSNTKNIYGRVESIIHKYNAMISQAVTPKQKIHAIAECIRNLEVIHPFYDANCRTMNLLLNKLLLENSLPPTILTNPNIIDAYSINELSDEIFLGMNYYQAAVHMPIWASPNYPANTPLVYLYQNKLLCQLFVESIMSTLSEWNKIDPYDREYAIKETVLVLVNNNEIVYTYATLQKIAANILNMMKNSLYQPLHEQYYQLISKKLFHTSHAISYKIKFPNMMSVGNFSYIPSYNAKDIFPRHRGTRLFGGRLLHDHLEGLF